MESVVLCGADVEVLMAALIAVDDNAVAVAVAVAPTDGDTVVETPRYCIELSWTRVV